MTSIQKLDEKLKSIEEAVDDLKIQIEAVRGMVW